jgi:hypothetical protein
MAGHGHICCPPDIDQLLLIWNEALSGLTDKIYIIVNF